LNNYKTSKNNKNTFIKKREIIKNEKYSWK